LGGGIDLARNENFDGKQFHGKAKGFSNPTRLPESDLQAEEWQKANKLWWERSPMRYDWQEDIPISDQDGEYFAEIDRRFFNSVSHYMPWKLKPFDNLIDFQGLQAKDVLEIGVGHGSHAELIAPNCRSFVGIDLTEKASQMTRQRMQLRGINAHILQMDAERMTFENESFDWIWSWGVIHHSANTQKIIQEMARVLRIGGSATVMIYHKSPWKYYIADGLMRGIFRGELFRSGSVHAVSQQATDGAIARFYTRKQWRELCSANFSISKIEITGLKTDVFPIPPGKFKESLMSAVPDRASRFLTNQLRFGTFLVAHMEKLS